MATDEKFLFRDSKRMSDIFTKCDIIRQKRADSDPLFAYFFGHRCTDDVMQTIVASLDSFDIPPRMKQTLVRASTDEKRTPMLFVMLFGLWIGAVDIAGCPLRSEKFKEVLERECYKMITGEYVNIHDFVTNTLTEYLI